MSSAPSMPPPLDPPPGADEEVMSAAHADAAATTHRHQQFPCGQCGAKLDYQPGTSELACPYCGHRNPIPQSEDEVLEIDFQSTLADLAQAQPTQQQEAVHCNGCGADINRPANLDAMLCPFCGSNVVMTAQSRKLIKPQALLPFRIDRKDAQERFKQWIAGLWFAPGTLKKYAEVDGRFNGVYLPFWTYDSDTVTVYRGMRGEHYWTTETRTVIRNGKSVRETVQVRKTRWWPCSGTVFESFDDVLTPASRSLPRKYVEALEPWDLPAVQPYEDAYLSGFRAESYTVELDEGFTQAQAKMETVIRSSVRSDIGGDEQRILSLRTQYNNVTFKHLLLPIWIAAYRHGEKVYRILVNARTGEVQGERPWSWIKITLAVLGAAAVIGTLAAVFAGR